MKPQHASADFVGRVIRIVDGDLVEVRKRDNTTARVRLYGIDAPEKDQPFAEKSKDYLSTLVANKMVVVKVHGTDADGRSLGEIYLEGALVNSSMIREGYAWHVQLEGDHNTFLEEAEAAARAASRGLWSEANSVPPWEWRLQEPDAAEIVK